MKKLFLLIVIISSVVTAGVAQHRPHHRGHRPHHEKKENPVAPEFLKKGDKVLYGKYAGTELEYDGEKYLIMRQSDVVAILK